MISYYQRPSATTSVSHIPEFVPDTWVYVSDPTEDELTALVALGLERDLLQDAIDPNEVPRVQHEQDVTYFFLRAPRGQGDQTQTVPLLVAIAPTFLLTLSRQPFSWLEHFLHSTTAYSTLWRSQLVWRILLALNNRYSAAITDMGRRVRSNIGTNHSIQNEDILRMVAYEGVINDLLAALQPINTVLTNVSAGKLMKIYDEDKDLMEDVYLGNTQVLEAARQQLRTAINTREAYSVIATNNLNRVIKFLTLVTVILTVPMVVSGLYGMNVTLPLGQHPYAFGIIIVMTTGIVLGLLHIFSRKRLL